MTDEEMSGDLLGAIKPSTLPLHMDIDLSSKCNLRCSFCHLSYFNVPNSSQISFEYFMEKIDPILKQLKSVTLFSKYEPLTCRDFVKIFNRISEYGIETYFSTNAILFTEESIEAIVGRLRWLTVSVTGFNREDYARHMGADRLDKVVANLRAINELKRKRGVRYPMLRISTVGMLDTLEDLPRAVDFAKEHQAEEGVQVTALIAYGEEMVERMPLKDRERFVRLTQEALRYAREQGVRMALQSGGMEENQAATRELGHRPCFLPWRRLSVQPDGAVYPCPVSYKPVGNLAESSLEEIWNGSALEAFRAGVNDPARMNPECRGCTHCRHKSIIREDANDYSKADVFFAGMVRKN